MQMFLFQMVDLRNRGSFAVGDAVDVLIEGWYFNGVVRNVLPNDQYHVRFPDSSYSAVSTTGCTNY